MNRASFQILVCFFLFSGCASVAIDRYITDHPGIPRDVQNCMRQKRLCVGMSKGQVEITFGKPIRIFQDELDEKETWVYSIQERGFYSLYEKEYNLAFDNDEVVRIETADQFSLRLATEKYFNDHPDRIEYKNNVSQKKIKIGMDKEEVKLSWGRPTGGINRTVTTYGNHEQWIYLSEYHNDPSLDRRETYLYFDDDVLTALQD